MSYYKMPVAEFVYKEHFKEMDVTEDVYLTFASKNNNKDKFLYVHDLLKQYDWLPKKIDGFIKLSQAHRRWRKRLKKKIKQCGILINMNCTTAKKNNNISDLYRTRGNGEFKIKNYEESLKFYTLSTMTAEIDSINFALSVANRSAALYYLEEFEHCLKDIDKALISKQYPLQNKYKLFERKGNCYRRMNQQSLALEMYTNSLFQLNNTAQLLFTEKEKIITRISDFIKKCQQIEDKFQKPRKPEIKYICFSEQKNDNFSVLSKFVEIKFTDEMGRGLFATKNIKPGEILVIEKPVAGVLKNNMWIFNCNYCFKRCLSGIPCAQCSLVLYCDESCLQNAYTSYHCIQCSLIYPLKGDPTIEPTHDLALRCFIQLINVMGIDRYCSMVEKYNESKINMDKIHIYLMDDFYSIYALKGNETNRTVSNLFFMHCSASMIISLLLLNDYHIPPDLLGIVGESLVHLLCVSNLNSHASVEFPKHISKISNNVIDNSQPDTLNTVALILCTAYSLINHSCDPNVIVQSYDGIEVVRTIQPISKGSQLFTDYGVNFMLYNREERNKHLFDQYHFHCKCQACTKNWPIYYSLKCIDLYISNFPDLSEDYQLQLSIPKENSSKFNEIVNLLLTQRKINLDHLDFLFSFLDFLYSNLKIPYTNRYKCIQVIQKCLYYTSDQLNCTYY